jgi:hypothetical protein
MSRSEEPRWPTPQPEPDRASGNPDQHQQALVASAAEPGSAAQQHDRHVLGVHPLEAGERGQGADADGDRRRAQAGFPRVAVGRDSVP